MADELPGADPEIEPDFQAALALLDLRAVLVAIAKLDPSNVGNTSGSSQWERYAHRNMLVVQALGYAMAAGLSAGIMTAEDSAWPLIFIDLPTGAQVSWHMPAYTRPYDGHTTEEKYQRIRAFDQQLRSADGRLTD
jgi:hypothetical protein